MQAEAQQKVTSSAFDMLGRRSSYISLLSFPFVERWIVLTVHGVDLPKDPMRVRHCLTEHTQDAKKRIEYKETKSLKARFA